MDASQIVRERQTQSSGVSDAEKTNRRTGETDEDDGCRMSYVHGKWYGQRFVLKFHFSERCVVGQDDCVRRAVVSLDV